jgi:hypothetical protein
MLEKTKKISLELDAIRSRVEDLRDDFQLEWFDEAHPRNTPARAALLEESKNNCEDAAELIEDAVNLLDVIGIDHALLDAAK